MLNPLKAGVSNLCIAWGAIGAPPGKKPLENMFRVEMHVQGPIFHGQLKEKKIRLITYIVRVLGRVEKNAFQKYRFSHKPVSCTLPINKKNKKFNKKSF